MQLLEILVLGLVLGPILEESFFRGCLLPVLAHTVVKILAVVLTAFAVCVHSPAYLVPWASQRTSPGIALDPRAKSLGDWPAEPFQTLGGVTLSVQVHLLRPHDNK